MQTTLLLSASTIESLHAAAKSCLMSPDQLADQLLTSALRDREAFTFDMQATAARMHDFALSEFAIGTQFKSDNLFELATRQPWRDLSHTLRRMLGAQFRKYAERCDQQSQTSKIKYITRNHSGSGTYQVMKNY